MPNPIGFYDSPGERRRREAFQRTRRSVLDILEPRAREGLSRVIEEANQVPQLGGGPPGREPFRTTLAPAPTPRQQGPTIGPANEPVSELPFGVSPQLPQGRGVTTEPQPFARLAAPRERLSIGGAGALQDPFAVGPGPGEVLEAERREVQQFTRPALRRVGETLGTTIAQQIPGLGIVEPQVRAGVGAAVETVGAELALPTNLIPIPFIDPVIARALGFAPEAIRTGARVVPEVLQGIRRRIATLVDDPALGGKARKLVDDIGQLLPSERGALDVGPGAVEPTGAVPSGEAAQAPPPAQSPTGQQLPERGRASAQQSLDLKEETLLRPGRVTRLPGVRQAVSGLNPSVSIDRQTLVSYNARQSVGATLETSFAARRLPVVQRLQGAWDAQPPRYTGPSDNAMKNTIKDWADNPEFYSGVSDDLRAAARAYDDVSNQLLAEVRGEYGVDIRAFSSEKAGSFYLPTVAARETLDASLLKVSQGYTSSGVPVSSARAKTRVYDGAYQRQQNNPGFQAETDLAELTSLHDRALSTMAGNETFRLGAGGRTKLDVMQELHPALFDRMIALRRRLSNLRGTAGRLNERTQTAIDDFLTAPDGDLADLADALDVTVKRGGLKGQDVRAVNSEIRGIRQEIRALRPAWESANLEPFVFNKQTFRYHTGEQSEAIDKILLTKLNIGEGLVSAIDEVRLFAFSADVSPLTIQGMLGLLADPITGARSLPGAKRALFDPAELLRIAEREPEMVARFTQATGRAFGQLGTEFVQRARGIERIPGGRQLNDRLMSAVELVRYNQWKTDTALVQLGGATQNVADAEAANALSKVIPALNPAESGKSVLRARAERVPFISTSFIGGPATVIKDAASGLAKLTASRSLSPVARWQALAGREQLAIIHLARITGSVMTAGIVTHIASGWSPEDAVKVVTDPGGPRFMSIALGPKRRIPLGGPLRSAFRAFVPQKVGEAKGIPIYAPFAGTAQWLRGKVTPALKAPIDLARDKDYFGGKIASGSFPENILRMIWYGVNSVLPLAIAEPSEAVRRGEVEPTDVGALAERGGAQLAGVDLRETSPFERLNTAFREETGREYDGGEDARQVAEQSDVLRPLLEAFDASGVGRGSEVAIQREERTEVLAVLAEGLRPFVEGVRAGDSVAGEKFREAFSTFKAQAFAISLRDVLNVDFPEPDSELGQLVGQYRETEPQVDPITFQTDWATFDRERDAILVEIGKLAPEVVDALQNRLRLPEEFQDVERQFQAAAQRRDELGDIPLYVGLKLEDHDRVREFLAAVTVQRKRWLDRGQDVPLEAAIRSAGPQWGVPPGAVEWAVCIRSSGTACALQRRNPDYDQFIRDNREELELFYPDLITRRIREAGVAAR